MMRGASFLWIAATIAINVVAFAALLYRLDISRPEWYGPFIPISSLYDQATEVAFGVMADWVKNTLNMDLPRWAIHIMVLYGSTASAIAASGMGVTKRESFLGGLGSAGISASWPLAVPAFLWHAVRFRVVSAFARDHGLAFCAYAVTVVGTYLGARYLNTEVFAPEAEAVSAILSPLTG